ncbi:MAG: hypothetical protein K2Y19_06275, partial [Afipia birgiae]|nr:hypothetical protein [Afipia birgiae]
QGQNHPHAADRSDDLRGSFSPHSWNLTFSRLPKAEHTYLIKGGFENQTPRRQLSPIERRSIAKDGDGVFDRELDKSVVRGGRN